MEGLCEFSIDPPDFIMYVLKWLTKDGLTLEKVVTNT